MLVTSLGKCIREVNGSFGLSSLANAAPAEYCTSGAATLEEIGMFEGMLTLNESFQYCLIRELSDCLLMRAFYLLSHLPQQVQYGSLFAMELVSCTFECTISVVVVALCHMEHLRRSDFAGLKNS